MRFIYNFKTVSERRIFRYPYHFLCSCRASWLGGIITDLDDARPKSHRKSPKNRNWRLTSGERHLDSSNIRLTDLYKDGENQNLRQSTNLSGKYFKLSQKLLKISLFEIFDFI